MSNALPMIASVASLALGVKASAALAAQAPATYFNHVFRKSVGVNPVRRNADEK